MAPSGCLRDSVDRVRRGGGSLVGSGWCSPTRCTSSELQFGSLREVVAHKRQGVVSHCVESDLAEQHAQADRDTLHRASKHQIR